MTQKYQDYFNSFLKYTDGVFRQGVGVNMSFFPFLHGTIICVELKENEHNKAIKRKESADLAVALSRTQLYDEMTCSKFKNKSVEGSLYVVINPAKYLIIKSDSETEWKEDASLKDFFSIIKKIKERYTNEK